MDKFFSVKPKGFTIVEAMVSLAIGTLFLGAVISAWTYSTKLWKEESLRSELRYNIEQAMERIKLEARLANGNDILFYPASASTHTAISFPYAAPASSGLLTIGNTGITWDKTIVYSIHENEGSFEMKRTVFNSFNTDDDARQVLLDGVAESGAGPLGTATETMFTADDIEMTITPINPTFDGYAASTSLSSNTSFGHIRLTAGAHEIRFEVTGKNASSSGYQMGLDRIALTPSGGSQEVEALDISASSGRTTTEENMTAYSGAQLWGGAVIKCNMPPRPPAITLSSAQIMTSGWNRIFLT